MDSGGRWEPLLGCLVIKGDISGFILEVILAFYELDFRKLVMIS